MAFVVHRRGPVAALCLILCWSTTAAVSAQPAQAPAGRIKAVVGSASIVRSGAATPATVGALVYEADLLRTGADGQLAVMLRDESRLSLGPGAELALASFSYAPEDGRLGLVLRMARGALAYVSGRIAALMPEAVRLETPTSVIGVRGTHALVHVEAP